MKEIAALNCGIRAPAKSVAEAKDPRDSCDPDHRARPQGLRHRPKLDQELGLQVPQEGGREHALDEHRCRVFSTMGLAPLLLRGVQQFRASLALELLQRRSDEQRVMCAAADEDQSGYSLHPSLCRTISSESGSVLRNHL